MISWQSKHKKTQFQKKNTSNNIDCEAQNRHKRIEIQQLFGISDRLRYPHENQESLIICVEADLCKCEDKSFMQFYDEQQDAFIFEILSFMPDLFVTPLPIFFISTPFATSTGKINQY